MTIALRFLAAGLCVFFAHNASAKDFPAAGRIFAGTASVDPKDVNLELTSESLKEIDSVTNLGVEITYPIAKYLDIGLRYTKKIENRDELDSDPATEYVAELDQSAIAFVGRVSFLETTIFRLDAFAGIGGSNTTLKIKTAGQDGEYSRKEGGDWVAAPYAVYGASVGIGYKKVYFVIEAGMEVSKIEDLKTSGTVNSNIETIDLSGSYFTVGILFDGITASK